MFKLVPSRARALAAVALTALAPLAAAAQEAPVVSSLQNLHDMTSDYILQTARMVSEDLYAFRPTEEVRTLGEILAHVANSQYAFCSGAAGEESPNSENLEETLSTKAEISAALEEAFAYCDGVYAEMSDEAGATMRTFFGQERAAAAILAFNTTHNYEHYGNLVTYMRINGITPPSSM